MGIKINIFAHFTDVLGNVLKVLLPLAGNRTIFH